jgi:predicted porin
MRMKKHALAAAALCVTLPAVLPAMAQTADSVTLYGIIDTAVRTQSGLTSTYARSPINSTVVASGVGPTSRWGLRGSEDLGGGLRATFNLEGGINIDTGAQANATTLFDRASVVGLAGSWGGITAGRQNTLIADSAGVTDPIGLRFAGMNPNIQNVSLTGHQLGVEYGTTGSTGSSNRVNNSLKYSVPIGPVVARAMYSMGEVGGSSSKLRTAGLGADYRTPVLDITTAYTSYKDVNDRDLSAANIGASWLVLPSLRLMANYGYNSGYTSATAEATNRVKVVGLNYAATSAIDVLAGYYQVDRHRTALPDDGFKRLLAFVEYKFSRRSKVYIEFDNTRWKGDYLGAGNKPTSSGLSLGITHVF